MSGNNLEDLRGHYINLRSLVDKIESGLFYAQKFRSYRMPDMEREKYTEIKKELYQIIDQARLMQGECSAMWGKATDDYWERKDEDEKENNNV